MVVKKPMGNKLNRKERKAGFFRDFFARFAPARRSHDAQGKFAEAVFTTAIDCIVTADESGVITAFNPAAEHTFGWASAEIVGCRLDETIIPERYREAHRKGMQRMVEGGQGRVIGQRVELEGLRRDGTCFPLELALAEAKMDGERQFIAYLRDLTDQRDAEAKLVAAESQLRGFFDNVPAGMSIKDRDRRFTMINEFGAKRYGRTPDELIGADAAQFRAPQYAQQVWDIEQRILDFAKPNIEEVAFEFEGEQRHAQSMAFPIIGNDGSVTHIGSMTFDITPQKRAEAELKESRALLQTFFDHLPGLAFLASLDGRVIEANNFLAENFGLEALTRERLIGRPIEEVRPAEWRETAESGHREMLEHHRSVQTTVEYALPDDTRRHLLAIRFPILNDEGDITHYGGMLFDRTEEEDAQAQLIASRESLHQSEKLAALGQLLAGVAHELNNPLAIVVGRAAMLKESLQGTVHETAIEKLRAAADRCGRIVKTFLAMARQSGPSRSLVDLNDLVEGALDMTAYGLRSAGIEVVQDLAEDLPLTHVDGDQIVQVLINLIVNAQHAIEAGGKAGTLTIATRMDGMARQLQIEVADTGGGIPPAIVSRIFDPFFTTKDVGSGTGMGLSVSKGMIEAQGGTLELTANSAKGARFLVSVPLRRAQPEPHTATGEQHGQSVEGRVLIVDDEREIAELLGECLLPLGLQSQFASDGREALALLESNAFDAILTDVRMAGMDGIAFYQEVQRRHPAIARSVAFISGDVLQSDPVKAAAIAGRPLIEKPFNPDQVRKIVSDLLFAGEPQ